MSVDQSHGEIDEGPTDDEILSALLGCADGVRNGSTAFALGQGRKVVHLLEERYAQEVPGK